MELTPIATVGTTDLWWDSAACAVVISDDTTEALTGITSIAVADPDHVYDALKDVRCSNMPAAVFTAVTALAVAGHGEVAGVTIDNTTGTSHTDYFWDYFWVIADGEHKCTVRTDNPADAGRHAYEYACRLGLPTYAGALGLWLSGDGRVVFNTGILELRTGSFITLDSY